MKTMSYSTNIASVVHSADTDLAWQRDFYEDLHRHPELSHEEERTAARIRASTSSTSGRWLPERIERPTTWASCSCAAATI